MPVETIQTVFTVSGTIYDEFDNPLPNLIVKLYDKDFRSEQLLGEKTTNVGGNYTIEFNSERAMNPEYERVDLFIKVFDATGVPKGQSSIYFNIKGNITIDFKVGNTAYRGGNEFDNLLQKIKPVLEPQDVPLGKLEENGQYRDISFLANELSENEEKIAFINTAFQLSHETRIAPDIFYGWLRLGFPKDVNHLLQVKVESLVNALKEAIAENIISSRWSTELENIVKTFNALAVRHILSEGNEQSVALKKLLNPILSGDQQKIFVETWAANEQGDKFWDQLGLQPGFNDTGTIEKIKRVVQLNVLTGNQPALTNLLFRTLESQNGNPSTLARLSLEDWKRNINEAGVTEFPKWVTGDTNADKIDNYAETLDAFHKEFYPTVSFTKRLETDNSAPFRLKEQVGTFLNNNPEFDLKTTSIKNQFATADFTGVTDRDGLTNELKVINRLNKITDNYDSINVLYSKELFSANDIVTKYGEEEFKTAFADSLGGTESAAATFAKAVSTSNKVSAFLFTKRMAEDTPIYAINGPVKKSESYHEMFSDRELCACSDCQSVYSPSAYFVDLLRFIKDQNAVAYTELTRRRPDLDDILLTCKNTNTALPYIDLVNELLEKKVIKISDPNLVPDPEDHSFQTEGTAENLLASPEHINAAAYEKLKNTSGNQTFSNNLPLDLFLEETRIFAEKLGWKRHELMENFYDNSQPSLLDDPAIATEFLGFSKEELNLINGQSALGVMMPRDVNNQLVDKVNVFLDHTRLTYADLFQLTESYFLNPENANGRTIQITGAEAGGVITCDLSKMSLTGADDLWLTKMVRFLRLQRKLGWDIFDLDRILLSINQTNNNSTPDFPAAPGDFNNQFLVPISNLQRIQKRIQLPLREVAALCFDIDGRKPYRQFSEDDVQSNQTLYEDIFRNKFVIADYGNSFPAGPINLSGKISDNKQAVCSALGITEPVLDLISLPAEDMNLISLSRLYRLVKLAAILSTTTESLHEFLSITDKKPVDGRWSPSGLLEFFDDWINFSQGGLPVNEYKAIVTQKNIAIYSLPIDNNLISQFSTCVTKIEAIQSSVAAEHIKDELARTELASLIDSIKSNAALISALTAEISHPASALVKSKIDEYADEKKSETLLSLNIAAILTKALQDKYLLEDYITCKNAPRIISKYNFSVQEIKWLDLRKTELAIDALWSNNPDPLDTTLYKTYRNVGFLSALKEYKSTDESSWMVLLDIAILNQAGAKENMINSMVPVFSLQPDALEQLIGPGNDTSKKGISELRFPQDFISAKILLEVVGSCKQRTSLGGSNDQFVSLINKNVVEADALAVRDLLRSRSTEKTWPNVVKPLNDVIRKKKRDALVAWLITHPSSEWRDASEIYYSLLIDPEMEACMLSSRIKQAISSVQLFVDRCLMNLEEKEGNTIFLGTKFAKQWKEWRKQYRVWEANRKVFLYPENWIEPELRNDKSPFFKELEAQLKQNEITEVTAKEALLDYLSKLDAVANLEVTGVYNEQSSKTVHVIGRAQNIPHQYYYRKRFNERWSPWEKIEVDIEGDHLLPVVWNGRLLLFWLLFTEKQVESGGETSITNNGTTMTMSSSDAPKYWEIKLAWSEYRKNKWSAKKISKEAISTQDRIMSANLIVNKKVEKRQIRLISRTIDNKLFLSFLCWAWADENKTSSYSQDLDKQRLDAFLFDNCNSSPVIVPNEAIPAESFEISFNTRSDGTFLWKKPPSADDTLKAYSSGLTKKKISDASNLILFKNTPGTFQLTPNGHNPIENFFMPFFYKNDTNNFFVDSYATRRDLGINISVENAGLLMARRSMTPVNVFPHPEINGIAAGTVSRSVRDAFDPDLFNGVKEPVKPSLVFYGRRYQFYTFYHPFVCNYISRINTKGIDDLYSPEVQAIPDKIIFSTSYGPTGNVAAPYPKEELDFSAGGSYSIYNWELFYHIPQLIATRFSQEQKFEEARKWFHYIFDPTLSTAIGGSERFWITKPFIKEIENTILPIDDLLNDETYATELAAQLTNWEENPFDPHAVARLRVSAYMRNTVSKYIDNLIAWGDQLFSRDTIESINEATLLYLLASNILGKKREAIPAPKLKEESFSTIISKIDLFSNAKTEIETFISASPTTSGPEPIRMPYFGLPKNEFILKYWDLVADRLFKIRNCRNIEGVFRLLPLFEPPLDPGMMIKMKNAGLDIIDSILNDNVTSMSHYRFPVMLQKANELCNDVKSLGSQLLSAIEKRDAESLAILRSGHEINILNRIKLTKEKVRDEAKENLESLLVSKSTIEERRRFYSSRELMNPSERQYYNSLSTSLDLHFIQSTVDTQANLAYMVPDLKAGAPTSVGATYGGTNIGNALKAFSNFLGTQATTNNIIGSMANVFGGYQRRMDDWKFQVKTADLELKQIERNILAAEIRLAIAEREIENHDLQTEQAGEARDYMQSKFTNEELYSWMITNTAVVYRQCYQLAYATAKKAEKCMRYELGSANGMYIEYGHWDSLKKGLLSGEKLQYDLRRLELAYLEDNKREMEITKHISLSQLNSLELLKFRKDGTCKFKLREELFDLDFPGHYFRRIKVVSISIPCIAGTYTTINATLKLVNNEYRMVATNEDGTYSRTGDENTIWGIGKFRTVVNPAISIATSSAQNDSGVFELNFRDERYLPFEGSGVISEWSLDLNQDFRQFDYNSISDVIMHLRYTAREETKVADIKSKVKIHLDDFFKTVVTNTDGFFTRMISLKLEFPNAFYQLINSNPQKTTIDITNNHFNWVFASRKISVQLVEAFLIPKNDKKISADPADFKIQSVQAAGWADADFGKKIKQSIFSLNAFDPRTQLSIEAGTLNGNNGLVKDELDDILISMRFNIS